MTLARNTIAASNPLVSRSAARCIQWEAKEKSSTLVLFPSVFSGAEWKVIVEW